MPEAKSAKAGDISEWRRLKLSRNNFTAAAYEEATNSPDLLATMRRYVGII